MNTSFETLSSKNNYSNFIEPTTRGLKPSNAETALKVTKIVFFVFGVISTGAAGGFLIAGLPFVAIPLLGGALTALIIVNIVQHLTIKMNESRIDNLNTDVQTAKTQTRTEKAEKERIEKLKNSEIKVLKGEKNELQDKLNEEIKNCQSAKEKSHDLFMEVSHLNETLAKNQEEINKLKQTNGSLEQTVRQLKDEASKGINGKPASILALPSTLGVAAKTSDLTNKMTSSTPVNSKSPTTSGNSKTSDADITSKQYYTQKNFKDLLNTPKKASANELYHDLKALSKIVSSLVVPNELVKSKIGYNPQHTCLSLDTKAMKFTFVDIGNNNTGGFFGSIRSFINTVRSYSIDSFDVTMENFSTILTAILDKTKRLEDKTPSEKVKKEIYDELYTSLATALTNLAIIQSGYNQIGDKANNERIIKIKELTKTVTEQLDSLCPSPVVTSSDESDSDDLDKSSSRSDSPSSPPMTHITNETKSVLIPHVKSGVSDLSKSVVTDLSTTSFSTVSSAGSVSMSMSSSLPLVSPLATTPPPAALTHPPATSSPAHIQSENTALNPPPPEFNAPPPPPPPPAPLAPNMLTKAHEKKLTAEEKKTRQIEDLKMKINLLKEEKAAFEKAAVEFADMKKTLETKKSAYGEKIINDIRDFESAKRQKDLKESNYQKRQDIIEFITKNLTLVEAALKNKTDFKLQETVYNNESDKKEILAELNKNLPQAKAQLKAYEPEYIEAKNAYEKIHSKELEGKKNEFNALEAELKDITKKHSESIKHVESKKSEIVKTEKALEGVINPKEVVKKAAGVDTNTKSQDKGMSQLELIRAKGKTPQKLLKELLADAGFEFASVDPTPAKKQKNNDGNLVVVGLLSAQKKFAKANGVEEPESKPEDNSEWS